MKKMVLLATMLLLAMGCATAPQSPEPTASDLIHNPKAGDVLAHGTLEVRRVALAASPAFTGLTILVKNKTSSDVKLAYLVHWYEKDGTEATRGPMQWTPISLPAQQDGTLHSTAPVPWLRTFAVEIKSR